MIPLRLYVHLNNAKLETCSILALFLGSCCCVDMQVNAVRECGTFGEACVSLNRFPYVTITCTDPSW